MVKTKGHFTQTEGAYLHCSERLPFIFRDLEHDTFSPFIILFLLLALLRVGGGVEVFGH